MTTAPNENTEAADDEQTGRRSPGLVLVGIVGLLIAAWGIAGGFALPDAGVVGWAAVGIGLAVGLVLILTGARSTRQ